MQKGVNTAGLKLFSLESPAWEVVPWLVSVSLDFGRVPPVALLIKDSLLCLNCLCTQCSLCWTPDSFWKSGILVHAKHSVWPEPVRTLGPESLIGFPGQKHCTEGTVSSRQASQEGESMRKPGQGLPRHHLSLFLMIRLRLLTMSGQCNYVLSSMSPPSGGGLGDPNTLY